MSLTHKYHPTVTSEADYTCNLASMLVSLKQFPLAFRVWPHPPNLLTLVDPKKSSVGLMPESVLSHLTPCHKRDALKFMR